MCRHSLNTVLSGPLSNADNFFFVADTYLRNIYQVDATTSATAQLLPFGAASRPIALAYDSTAKLLYWTDVATHTINRYSLRTNTSTLIYRDPANAGNCEGLNCLKSVSCTHMGIMDFGEVFDRASVWDKQKVCINWLDKFWHFSPQRANVISNGYIPPTWRT